jgi:hypothetical protein
MPAAHIDDSPCPSAELDNAFFHYILFRRRANPSFPYISSAAQQNRLSNPSTRATDLFVLLHGMLFNKIQLDDFRGTLACFLERLEMEGGSVDEREWVLSSSMAGPH